MCFYNNWLMSLRHFTWFESEANTHFVKSQPPKQHLFKNMSLSRQLRHCDHVSMFYAMYIIWLQWYSTPCCWLYKLCSCGDTRLVIRWCDICDYMWRKPRDSLVWHIWLKYTQLYYQFDVLQSERDMNNTLGIRYLWYRSVGDRSTNSRGICI